MANVITTLPADVETFAVLPSAARIASPDTQEFRGLAHPDGLILVVNATAKGTAPSVVVKVQGVDELCDVTWDILTSAAITNTGVTVLRIRPGITPAANLAVADILPPVVRVVVTHTGADSLTYSISGHLDRG